MANAKVQFEGLNEVEIAALGKASGKADLSPGDHPFD